jgi:type VII secretion integral membrane protein EccD
MTATADRPITTKTSGPLVAASTRVSLLVGDEHQIDVLLPAAVPLNKLAEPTRDVINQRLRSIGATELPRGSFVFARVPGVTMLAGNLPLAAQGVNDADLLAFVPAVSAQRYEPNIENVSAAIAKWAKDHFLPVSAADATRVAVALTTLALAVCAVLVWRMRWASDGGWLAPAIFAGTAAVVALTTLLATRMGADRFVAGTTSWTALASLVTAGATAPPGAHIGAPHAFLAAGVALVAASGLARLTRRYFVAATAVVTVSVAVLGAAAARMFFSVPGQRIAVVMLVGVLTLLIIAPSIGRRLANVPQQTFDSITGDDMYSRNPGEPEDTISPVADSPRDVTLRGQALAEVAQRSNQVLMGVLLGIALVQIGASWCAIHPGSGNEWTFVVVAVTVALIAVLRARAFRDRRHSITVVAAAAVALFAIPAHYGFAAHPTPTNTLWAAAVIVAIALGALLAGAIVPNYTFSEPVREVVEYLEYFATTVVIVFSAWTIDLLHFARYH